MTLLFHITHFFNIGSIGEVCFKLHVPYSVYVHMLNENLKKLESRRTDLNMKGFPASRLAKDMSESKFSEIQNILTELTTISSIGTGINIFGLSLGFWLMNREVQ